MDATQEDLGNPPVESSESEESGDDANSGDGAEGSGIAGG